MCANSKFEPTKDLRCGTYAGYQAHRTRGENSCEPCKQTNKVSCAEYAQRHPDRKKIKDAKYREANRQKIRDYSKQYSAQRRITNPDYEKNRKLKWKTNNPEKQKEKNRRYRASKFGVQHESFTTQMVLDKYGNFCHICLEPIEVTNSRIIGSLGWELSLHLDHLIPLVKGGSDTLENIRPAHGICNIKKGANN